MDYGKYEDVKNKEEFLKDESSKKKRKFHKLNNKKDSNNNVVNSNSRAGPLMNYLHTKKMITDVKSNKNNNNSKKNKKSGSNKIIDTIRDANVMTRNIENNKKERYIINDNNIKLTKEKTRLKEIKSNEKKKRQKIHKDSDNDNKDDVFDPSYLDPHIIAEEAEIARLEKLLGFKGKKSGLYKKLNKEYEMFEGFGADFGDFLGQLDELSDVVKQKNYDKKVFAGEANKNNDNDDDDGDYHDTFQGGHIIDDDEQEVSDIDEDIENSGDDDDDNNDNEEDDNNDNEEDSEEDNEESNEDHDNDVEEDDDNNENIYRPTLGEDIYGRIVDEDAHTQVKTGAYIPPALRKQLANTIDESSEKVRLLRRSMNGLMNKLSDQTKDQIIRQIKSLFDNNSISATNLVLKDCIMAACSNSTQMMISLIPIYAGIVSGLHLTVGIDVGAFLVEHLTVTLKKSIDETHNANNNDNNHPLVSDKQASNYLLLLIYLYNFRTLHHSLITDIMFLLAKVDRKNGNDDDDKEIGEFEIELLLCLVDHCGAQLRSDDPIGLKDVITCIKQRANNSINKDSARVRFMLEAMTDLKNNKSRRLQSSNEEIVKKMRKWIGTIKTSMVCKPGDLCLRVTLKDLLNAETKGRWWRAGASWIGKNVNDDENDKVTYKKLKDKVITNSEEEKLLLLAQKMKFNTASRRNVFVIIMSSRDINDAFERLSRLDLKGKEDREIIRVLVECCGQEKNYNAFYAELCSLLCHHNRQFKTTTQFTYWDFFKLLQEGNVGDRKVINLARLLSHLVVSFYLPLAIFKPLDMTVVPNNAVLLFLATFFISLFSSDISEETFQSIIDRVATTKDFAIIRDSLLFFLQKHFIQLAANIEVKNSKLLDKRRKQTVKILESMTVLDMSAGLMDNDIYDDNR